MVGVAGATGVARVAGIAVVVAMIVISILRTVNKSINGAIIIRVFTL
jgi:hypothetical protein